MKINRNIVWTEIFFNELAGLGVKHVCIAPGSRSTPLTYSAAMNNKFKSFVFIDERSCAFFALGLAINTNTPVVIICTSGTAVAELYPAIIEAYQQKVPLIVCTADRPPELIDNGANQTILQAGIYKDHVLWSFDTGLPEITFQRIKHIRNIGKRAVYECSIKNSGPVHLNFPFRKPLEPGNYTDDIDEQISENIVFKEPDNRMWLNKKLPIQFDNDFKILLSLIKQNKKGIIISGPDKPGNDYSKHCIKLAEILNYPILADGTSQLRYGQWNSQNIFTNYDAYLRTEYFQNKMQPDIILQFGRTVTSKGLDTYIKNTSARRFIINESGQWYDPYNNAETVLGLNSNYFCYSALQNLNDFESTNKTWLENFLAAEKFTKEIKEKLINKSEFPFEGRIINEVISLIPDKSALMVSNSMPVRDLDYFTDLTSKDILLFSNRGASGIDGIVSTALGIAASSSRPVVLITGDLAFYHDLNGLLASKKYSIPLVIILINNNGGGIFEMLPISNEYEKVFNEYFITPHNLDFSSFVKGYSGEFYDILNWNDFQKKLHSAINSEGLSVLQLKTDARESAKLRKLFFSQIDKAITNKFSD